MKRISANLHNIHLLTPSLLALCLFSTQNASAYECKLDDDTTGGALSFNNEVIACGKNAIAQGAFSTALGSNSDSLGYASTALGRAADSEGDNSTAVGRAANSAGASSTAIGRVANSLGESSTALGHAANSAGDFSTALGPSASSAGINSIALGYLTSSVGIYSTALGYLASSEGTNSIALGREASSAGESSTALGLTASSAGYISTALGRLTSSAGERSTALGAYASSAGERSTALGYNTDVDNTSPRGIAIGLNAKVINAPGGIAIGSDIDGTVGEYNGAMVLAEGAIALGADVTNDIPNSMKIAVPLRIQADAGTAQLLVEEASATTAVRSLIHLKNNGAVGFSMEDTTQGTWQFRSSSSGAFIMNKLGNTGSEATVFANGNATFKGTVRANGVLLTSSRASKTDFSAIKPNELMQKLAKMNVEEWRYKEADKNDRHISPMAEDFYSLFKLGADNTGINPNDLASVAIIAAKELLKKATLAELENLNLKQQLEEKTSALKADNASLKKHLVEQQKRLASLEKLVTNLASSSGRLNRSGAKIASK